MDEGRSSTGMVSIGGEEGRGGSMERKMCAYFFLWKHNVS